MSELPYEDAASRLTVEVWACRKCKRGIATHYQGAEHSARACCCDDKPCATPGCAGRVKGRTSRDLCQTCDDARSLAQWQERLAEHGVEWDGETPLCLDDDDRFFFGTDEVGDYLECRNDGRQQDEPPLTPEDLRLVLCEEEDPPTFEMGDFLADYLPDDDHGRADYDFAPIDALVNQWVKDHVQRSCYPTGKPVTPASVRVALGLPAKEGA